MKNAGWWLAAAALLVAYLGVRLCYGGAGVVAPTGKLQEVRR